VLTSRSRWAWQIDLIATAAEAGDPLQQRCLAAGHVDILTTDLAHVDRHRAELAAALL
jgi:hypothetical protein